MRESLSRLRERVPRGGGGGALAAFLYIFRSIRGSGMNHITATSTYSASAMS